MKYSAESVVHKLLGHLSPETAYRMYRDLKAASELEGLDVEPSTDPDKAVKEHLVQYYYNHMHNLVFATLTKAGIDPDLIPNNKIDLFLNEGAYEVIDSLTKTVK